MSLPNFLNPTEPPQPQQHKPPPATVVRHVAKRIEAQPLVKKIITSEPISVQPKTHIIKPAPAIVRKPPEFVVRNDDLLTFSIIAKIFLKKSEIEQMNQIFFKMLKSVNSYQNLNMKISRIVQSNNEVQTAWQMLIDRNTSAYRTAQSKVISKVKMIIQWYLQNDYTSNNVIEYFDFIVDAKDRRIPWVHVFSTILKQQLNITDARTVSQLVSYTRDMMELLPTRPPHKERNVLRPLSYVDLMGIDESVKKPFDLSSRINDLIPIINKKQQQMQQQLLLQQQAQGGIYSSQSMFQTDSRDGGKNGSGIGNDSGSGSGSNQSSSKTKSTFANFKRYTTSHIKFQSDTQNPFLFNEMTKTFDVDPDIYGRFKPLPEVMTSVQVQDFFQVLESIEVNENKVDRIYAFSECNPYAGYCMRAAGKEAFQSTWTEIEQYLDNQKVRDIVINRCRSMLPDLENEHQGVLEDARIVLATRPTNAFLASIKVTNIPNSFAFSFDSDEVSAYLLHFLSTMPNGKLSTSIQWFLMTVIPLLQRDNTVEFIHSQTYAGLLWHFSLLCDEIRPLLTATPLEINTFQAVIDSVNDKMNHQKASNFADFQTHRTLTDILRSIVAHKIIADDVARDATKHYGKYVENITHFYPLLERMSIACNYLRTDLHMKQLTILSQKLGIYDAGTTDGGILSRRGVYCAAIKNIKLHKLFIIKASHEQGKILLYPFHAQTRR